MDHSPQNASAGTPFASVKSLLESSIDYAGLFPPSSVSMAEAVLNYATYRNSNYAWMLGRFVTATARLDEFYEVAAEPISRDREPWRIAAVAGEDIIETIRTVKLFNQQASGALVDVIEVKANSGSKIYNTVEAMPEGVTAYFELPLDERLPELVSTLASHSQRAKIRTGGVTPDAFPSVSQIVRFVKTCLAANVPFKATAGLHHPIRCFRPLTYEEDSVMGRMHGFLNLFLMTCFAREGYRTSFLDDVMEEEFNEVFTFDQNSAAWRSEYSLNVFQIEAARKYGIQSFGSCSFDEPVSDLQKLGIL